MFIVWFIVLHFVVGALLAGYGLFLNKDLKHDYDTALLIFISGFVALYIFIKERK